MDADEDSTWEKVWYTERGMVVKLKKSVESTQGGEHVVDEPLSKRRREESSAEAAGSSMAAQ